jgi:hypothetical protein
MARLPSKERMAKRAYFEKHGLIMNSERVLSGAEKFTELARQANEIKFNGPAFKTELALDGQEISAAIDENVTFASRDVDEREKNLHAATVHVMSLLAGRMASKTSADLPGIEFPEFISKDIDLREKMAQFGDLLSSDDGISMTYVDPPSHVKACIRSVDQLLKGVPWHVVLNQLWLPTHANDQRTRHIVAVALWNDLQRTANGLFTLDEVKRNLFSVLPSDFARRLAVAGYPPAILAGDLWRGYRNEKRFQEIVTQTEVKQLLSDIGLPIDERCLYDLQFEVHLNKLVPDVFARIKYMHPQLGLYPAEPCMENKRPAFSQALRIAHGAVHGPPGFTGAAGIIEDRWFIQVLTSNEASYENVLVKAKDTVHPEELVLGVELSESENERSPTPDA